MCAAPPCPARPQLPGRPETGGRGRRRRRSAAETPPPATAVRARVAPGDGVATRATGTAGQPAALPGDRASKPEPPRARARRLHGRRGGTPAGAVRPRGCRPPRRAAPNRRPPSRPPARPAHGRGAELTHDGRRAVAAAGAGGRRGRRGRGRSRRSRHGRRGNGDRGGRGAGGAAAQAAPVRRAAAGRRAGRGSPAARLPRAPRGARTASRAPARRRRRSWRRRHPRRPRRPSRREIVPRWVRVTERPAAVSTVRLRPEPGTVPANVTVPVAGARTSAPESPPMSMPAVLPACVRVRRIEEEGLEDRPVGGPRPRPRSGRKDERGEDRRECKRTHRHHSFGQRPRACRPSVV